MTLTPLLPSVDASSAASTAGRSQMTGDFDKFLSILTTQLQNQDPTSPMDANQFTDQLVRFSQVEQLIGIRKSVDGLVAKSSGDELRTALGMVGEDVEAAGNIANLRDGKAEIIYSLPENASRTVIEVLSPTDQVVARIEAPVSAGRHTVTWNGEGLYGSTLDDGAYRLRVVARDADEQSIEASTAFVGRVRGVTSESGEMMLDIDGQSIPLTDIIGIHAA